MVGGELTVRMAGSEVIDPQAFETNTVYDPLSAGVGELMIYTDDVAPGMFIPFFFH